MHLDADSGVVQSDGEVVHWNDLSTRNNDVSSIDHGPRLITDGLNGQNYVRFDGVDDGLGLDALNRFSTGTRDRTIFVVANYRGGAWGGVSYGSPRSNQAFGLTVSGNGRLTVQAWGFGQDEISTNVGRGQGWLTQSVILRGNTTSHYRDGELIDQDPHTFATTDERLRIGVELNDNRHQRVDIAEIIVFKRALSEYQRQQVEAYLHAEYFSGGGGGWRRRRRGDRWRKHPDLALARRLLPAPLGQHLPWRYGALGKRKSLVAGRSGSGRDAVPHQSRLGRGRSSRRQPRLV